MLWSLEACNCGEKNPNLEKHDEAEEEEDKGSDIREKGIGAWCASNQG